MSLADVYEKDKAKSKLSKEIRRGQARKEGEKEALKELRGKRS